MSGYVVTWLGASGTAKWVVTARDGLEAIAIVQRMYPWGTRADAWKATVIGIMPLKVVELAS